MTSFYILHSFLISRLTTPEARVNLASTRYGIPEARTDPLQPVIKSSGEATQENRRGHADGSVEAPASHPPAPRHGDVRHPCAGPLADGDGLMGSLVVAPGDEDRPARHRRPLHLPGTRAHDSHDPTVCDGRERHARPVGA